jgi:GH15 family glucan-1,4-alpha-glucosidase
MPLRIEDYALIGDCETAALVGRDGSVDWVCWPRFDSDAGFALLGTPEHGRGRLAPFAEARGVIRQYQGDTLILETRFETDQGSVRLIDFMPPRGGKLRNDVGLLSEEYDVAAQRLVGNGIWRCFFHDS